MSTRLNLTVTRDDLAREVATVTGLPQRESAAAVTAVCDAIAESIQAGLQVDIRGLVRLDSVPARARRMVMPGGKEITVPARRRVRARWRIPLVIHPPENEPD